MASDHHPSPTTSLPTVHRRKPSISKLLSSSVLVLAIGFIIYVLLRDGGKILEQHFHFHPTFLILSFIIECSGFLISIPVWRRLLSCYGIHRTLRDDVSIYSYSLLALVLPGGVWNIINRSVSYQRLGEDSLSVATASIVETLIIGVAAVGLYSIITVIQPAISFWKNPWIGLLLSLVAVFLLQPRIFHRVVNWILRMVNRGKSFPETVFSFKQTLQWIGLEMSVLAIGGTAVFLLLASITPIYQANISSTIISVIAAWAAGTSAGSLLFWLPGTPVLRDGAMILALAPGLSLPMAIIFVLLVRLWSLASLVLWASLVWVFIHLQATSRPFTQLLTGFRKEGGKAKRLP